MFGEITTSLTFSESDEYAEKISRVSDIILEDLTSQGYFYEGDGKYTTSE